MDENEQNKGKKTKKVEKDETKIKQVILVAFLENDQQNRILFVAPKFNPL